MPPRDNAARFAALTTAPPPDRDHQPGRCAHLLADRRLDGPEGRFAILGEDGWDRLAGALDDDVVQIDEGTAQARCDFLAGHGLAGAHEAGEDDVGVRHEFLRRWTIDGGR